MTYLYFLMAALLYSLSASLPFWVTTRVQMAMAICIGVLTSLCWVGISRSVKPEQIPIYGLAFDSMLTMIFLLMPFFFISFNLSNRQVLGIIMVLTGIFLIKSV